MFKKILIVPVVLFVLSDAGAQNRHSPSSRFKSYKGLVMAGYQGWHDTPEDGAGRGWGHYLLKGEFGPGNCKFDLWPETGEYPKLYKTPFVHADGGTAYLPSDDDASTTDVRFKWMKDYGVDGVFMQRFIGNVRQYGATRNHFNKVLGDALAASRKYGRAIGVMYDLSGMRDSIDVPLLIRDWKNLVDSLKITGGGNDQTYLYHNGKPLVVLWGVGFNGRDYTIRSIERIIDFLKNDPVYGGCSVMLGLPTYWRTSGNDADPDPRVLEVIKKADVIHPWTIGRYKDQETYDKYREVQKGDITWCKENNVDYAATVFPGFSWHNLNPGSPFNQIPRNRGHFYWDQLTGAITDGAQMLYVAMFDEVDEGTAILKVSQDPPVGASRFVTFEPGIPSDYYLYLTGYAAKMLRKEIPFQQDIPLPASGGSALPHNPAPASNPAQQPLSAPESLVGQHTPDGALYRFRIARKGVMLDSATCYAWIPENVGTIRSVIVHLHGCTREGDARQMMYDIQWRALARKYHSVLLAPAFISGGNAKACVNWYNPDNGSDTVFLEMLDTLAVRSDHGEIKTIPWALWGHSGGSLWVTAMTGKYPGRVAVAVAEACGYDISNVDAALKVPMLHHNGIEDICYNNAAIVASGRKKGALWAHAINPVVASPMDGHQVHDLRFLAIPWMDACLAMRLPLKPGDADLRDMDTTHAWLGDTATRAIAASASYRGSRQAAFWFPNRLLAEKWVEYMATGTVTDSTPPPAPYNLSASYADNRVTLRWDADPDLESGIKTFIIYRNGKVLRELEYPTKTRYSKQTGYQRWNDGDQPAPIPAPEMTFTDSGADDKGVYTYQVSTVNWSDTVGKKSEKIKVKKGKVI
jgi:glycoprotein endo-alpha-1,2-mannosidase